MINIFTYLNTDYMCYRPIVIAALLIVRKAKAYSISEGFSSLCHFVDFATSRMIANDVLFPYFSLTSNGIGPEITQVLGNALKSCMKLQSLK